MEEKELATDAEMLSDGVAADADAKAAITDKHASSSPADMDPIDYVSLLMEQEHR